MNRPSMPRLTAVLSLLLILGAGLASAEDQEEAPPVVAASALKLSGYIQPRYTFDNSDNLGNGPDTFQLYRARLGLDGEIVKNIRYKFQFEAARTPMLLDATVEFHLIPDGFLRAGQFKVPFSQENLTSDVYLEAINLSQVVNKLVPGRDNNSNGRDIGAMADYRWRMVEGMVAVLNGSGINKADPDEKKDIAARLTVSPWKFLTVGVSQYWGHTIPAAAGSPIFTRNRTGLEVALVEAAFFFKAEYVHGVDNTTKASGWYLFGGYFILPKRLQALLRVESFDPNLDLAGNRKEMLLLGLNWYFTAKTKFQVNYELAKPEGQAVYSSGLLGQFQLGF